MIGNSFNRKKKNTMKTKIIFLFASLIIIALALPLNTVSKIYTPTHNSLKMIRHNNDTSFKNTGSSKHDSVKVDSAKSTPIIEKNYAKRYYLLQFIPDGSTEKAIKNNSSNKLSFRSYNLNDIKIVFLQLDSMFDKINYKGLKNDYVDSSMLVHPSINNYFENENNRENIKSYFKEYFNSAFIMEYGEHQVPGISSVKEKNKIDIAISILNNQINITTYNNPNYIELNLCIYDITRNKIYAKNKYFSHQTNVDISKYKDAIFFIKINGQIYKFIKI